MRRARRTRRPGAWLALAAMALQLVFSFGHIHPEDFFPPASHGAKVVAAATNDAAPQPPSKQAPGGFAHDNCAVCANMQIAASLLLPEPVLLLPPPDFGRPSPVTVAALVLTAPPHLLFQTRAPPTA